MAEMKMRPTRVKVSDFLKQVPSARRREDGLEVCRIMRRVSGKRATMWGPSIIGYGKHSYEYASGRTGEICKIGFSPRASSLVFYLGNFEGRAALLKRLGKHKMGNGGCIYINKLDDVDLAVLEQIIEKAFEQ